MQAKITTGWQKRPTKKQEAQRSDRELLRRVARYFKPYLVRLTIVALATLAATLLSLINPLLIRVLFDDALLKDNVKLFVILILIMTVVPVLIGLIGVGQTYINSQVGQQVMRDLRNQVHHHVQSMSLQFFTATRTGEILSRLANDINGVQSVVTDTFRYAMVHVSATISTLIAMLLLSPLLTLISLCLLPFFLLVTYNVGKIQRAISKERQVSIAELTVLMQESLSVSGALLTKAFGRQEFIQDRFAAENQKLTDLGIRQQLVGRWFFMSVSLFFTLAPVLIYFVAGWQILETRHAAITLGTIIAFTALQARIFALNGPVTQLLTIQVSLQGALALFERIFEYLDMPIDLQDAPNALRLSPQHVQGKITFREVSFRYAQDERSATAPLTNSRNGGKPCADERTPLLHSSLLERVPEPARLVLNRVSFDVYPGQLVALVGPSGAGKTTISYLVSRLYDVESGVVAIDEYNVRDIAFASLSQIIGMVTQETCLRHASVRENLLFARPDASDEQMQAAARAAAIHERILELEKGYETVVGERGYKLSGGEKQRIAIARAMLKDPRILLLDEATSSLDTHSERAVQQALAALMKGRTTLAIAHRLSTILTADLILVIQEGQILERGTHQELLGRSGVYAKLYYEQFAQEPHAR